MCAPVREGWLILSNSMATLHLPTGTLVFNYQRFIPLLPLLHIATSTDKLMEHLITVFSPRCAPSFHKQTSGLHFHNFACTIFPHFLPLLYDYYCLKWYEWFFFPYGNRFKSCSWKGVLTASKSQPCSGWHGWVECCSAEKYIQTGTVHKWNLLVSTAGCAVPLLRVYFGFLAFPLFIPFFLPLSIIIKRTHVHTHTHTHTWSAIPKSCAARTSELASSEIFFTFSKVRVAFQECCLHS